MTWAIAPMDQMFDPREKPNNYSSRLITDNRHGREPFEISPLPVELVFGEFKVGQETLSQTFTVTNLGFMPLAVKVPTLRGDVSSFLVHFLPRLLLLPGHSMQFVISFRPTINEDLVAYLDLDFGKFIDKHTVKLVGKGHWPLRLLDGSWRLDGSHILS